MREVWLRGTDGDGQFEKIRSRVHVRAIFAARRRNGRPDGRRRALAGTFPSISGNTGDGDPAQPGKGLPPLTAVGFRRLAPSHFFASAPAPCRSYCAPACRRPYRVYGLRWGRRSRPHGPSAESLSRGRNLARAILAASLADALAPAVALVRPSPICGMVVLHRVIAHESNRRPQR